MWEEACRRDSLPTLADTNRPTDSPLALWPHLRPTTFASPRLFRRMRLAFENIQPQRSQLIIYNSVNAASSRLNWVESGCATPGSRGQKVSQSRPASDFPFLYQRDSGVYSLVLALSNGKTPGEIVADYPELCSADIKQAMEYAAWLASEKAIIVSAPPQ